MADRIQNPYGYATPIGSGLSSIVDAFLAAPTPEQRAAEAAKMHALQVGAERDRAAAGYDDARTKELELKFGANKSLSDLLSDPTLYDPMKAQGIAVGGGLDPAGTNQILLTRQAITPGVQLQQMDPLAYAQFGKAGDTFTGFREDQARLDTDSRRDYNAKIYDVDQREAGADRRFSVETSPGAVTTLSPGNPLGVTTIQGNPTQDTVHGKVAQDYITNGGDVNAVLSPQTPLGAAFDVDKPDSGQSLVIGKDGSVTFSQGGAGVEMPTKNISDNIGAQQSIESYLRTSKELREIAATDPTLFGTTGNARRLLQSVAGQVDSAMQALGKSAPGVAKDADAVYEAALTDLSMAGIKDPAIYDPNLTDIDKMAILAAYQAAAAIAGQEGRGLSNEDFAKFRTIVGDPTAWGATRDSFMVGLNRLDRLALAEWNARRQALGQPPVDPNAAPQGANEQKVLGGRTYVKVNGQWMEVLP